MEAKFKVGDQVKVVNYGHECWLLNDPFNNEMVSENPTRYIFMSKSGNGAYYDDRPEIIGKIGIVSEVRECQEYWHYAIEGIPEKHSWYDEEQLELVYRPEYK